MSNYIKVFNESEQRYDRGLRLGSSPFRSVPNDVNFKDYDNYIFKNGDVMGEMADEEFPFKLKKDSIFDIISVKSESHTMIVEIESPKSYFCRYVTNKIGFSFVVSYNEELKEVITKAVISEEILKAFDIGKIKKEGLIDMAVNNLSKMISILNNDELHLSHPTAREMKIRRNSGLTSLGHPTLITTRHKNMLFICDAYPYFHEIDFKGMDRDLKMEKDGK